MSPVARVKYIADMFLVPSILIVHVWRGVKIGQLSLWLRSWSISQLPVFVMRWPSGLGNGQPWPESAASGQIKDLLTRPLSLQRERIYPPYHLKVAQSHVLSFLTKMWINGLGGGVLGIEFSINWVHPLGTHVCIRGTQIRHLRYNRFIYYHVMYLQE